MLRLPLLLAALFLVAAGPPVPPAVVAHAKSMAENCRSVGGKPGKSPELAQRGDLTGDGIDDWAINEGGFDCDGAASLYSGTGGANVVVYVGQPDGNARAAFAGMAHGMHMERRGAGAVLWLTVSGASCGQRNARSHADEIACDRPLVWDVRARKLVFAPLSQARPIR